MTPQERAAALCRALLQDLEFHNEFTRRDVDPVTKLKWNQQWQDMILLVIQQTRRAALLEAAEEIERFIDYSGGCVGTENDPRVVAVNRFITINIVPLLNRLAQEGS